MTTYYLLQRRQKSNHTAPRSSLRGLHTVSKHGNRVGHPSSWVWSWIEYTCTEKDNAPLSAAVLSSSRMNNEAAATSQAQHPCRPGHPATMLMLPQAQMCSKRTLAGDSLASSSPSPQNTNVTSILQGSATLIVSPSMLGKTQHQTQCLASPWIKPSGLRMGQERLGPPSSCLDKMMQASAVHAHRRPVTSVDGVMTAHSAAHGPAIRALSACNSLKQAQSSAALGESRQLAHAALGHASGMLGRPTWPDLCWAPAGMQATLRGY